MWDKGARFITGTLAPDANSIDGRDVALGAIFIVVLLAPDANSIDWRDVGLGAFFIARLLAPGASSIAGLVDQSALYFAGLLASGAN